MVAEKPPIASFSSWFIKTPNPDATWCHLYVLLQVLMVAEKPSIAKVIAEELGGPRGARQRRGISRAIQTYECTDVLRTWRLLEL